MTDDKTARDIEFELEKELKEYKAKRMAKIDSGVVLVKGSDLRISDKVKVCDNEIAGALWFTLGDKEEFCLQPTFVIQGHRLKRKFDPDKEYEVKTPRMVYTCPNCGVTF